MSPFRQDPSRTAIQRLAGRAVFSVALLVFLILGIVLVGDFSAQWWVLILPFVLLVRPLLAAIREGGRHPDPGWESTTRR